MICSLNLLEALAKYLDKTKCVGNLEDPSGLSLNLTGILCWVAWLASLTWDLIPCLHVKVSDIKDAGGGWRSVMFFPLAPYLLPASAVCRWRPGEDDDDYSSCQSEGKLISWVVTFKMFFIFTPTGIWGRWIFFKWAETINYIVTVRWGTHLLWPWKWQRTKNAPFSPTRSSSGVVMCLPASGYEPQGVEIASPVLLWKIWGPFLFWVTQADPNWAPKTGTLP